MSVESVITAGRRFAESRMLSTCAITRVTGKVLDETTGVYTPTVEPVYTGKCHLQLATPRVFARASQDQLLTEQQPILKLPVDGTGGITVGDVATITNSPLDESQVGLTLKIAGVHSATYATARRLPVYSITEVLNG